MKVLLVISHGSRKKESNEEIVALEKKMNENIGAGFDRVSCAFLQFANPLFHERVEELVKAGASQITVFPYFIAAGSHVITDIPMLIRVAAEKYPNVRFTTTPHLGKLKGITQLIFSETKA